MPCRCLSNSLGLHVALWNDVAITLFPFARWPQIKTNEPSKFSTKPWDSARDAWCCRYRLCLESLNDAVVVVIDAILSSSSHSGEQKGKKVPADFPTVESCYPTNYTTVTTLKSIALDLFFFHLKWHRASLLCFGIACRSNRCMKTV